MTMINVINRGHLTTEMYTECLMMHVRCRLQHTANLYIHTNIQSRMRYGYINDSCYTIYYLLLAKFCISVGYKE